MNINHDLHIKPSHIIRYKINVTNGAHVHFKGFSKPKLQLLTQTPKPPVVSSFTSSLIFALADNYCMEAGLSPLSSEKAIEYIFNHIIQTTSIMISIKQLTLFSHPPALRS